MSRYASVQDSIDIFGQDYVTVTLSNGSTVYSDTDTQIVIAVKDADGDAQTGYDTETVRIRVVDAEDDSTIQVKTDGEYADYVDETIDGSGVTVTDLELDCSANEGNTIIISAEILSSGSSRTPKVYGNASGTAAANGDYLLVETSTASITREEDFTLTITAKDGYDQTLTGETGEVDLSLSDTPDPSDALDDNGTPLTSVTLSSGTWTSSTVAVSGGSGVDTFKILAELDGYTDGLSDLLTTELAQPTLTAISYYGPGAASYTLAHASTDADTTPEELALGRIRYSEYYGTYRVARGGYKATDVSDGFTTITMNYDWSRDYWAENEAVEFRVVYSHSAPTSGADLVGLTVIDTITIDAPESWPGAESGSGQIDCSVALDGDSDVYIYVLATADDNDSGYPGNANYNMDTWTVEITDLTFS